MAEAVVDLPDPITPLPSVENADELLSQMAGEQIDRMLSEAESFAPADSPAALPDAEASIAQPIAIPLPELPAVEPALPATRQAETEAALPAEPDGLLVRILEALNTPFAACPEWLRDLLGKLAILLLINAVGFVVFALLMKHH